MAVRFGEYTAATGQPFTYHLTFEGTSNGVKWRAVVRDGSGALVAVPKGILAAGASDDAFDVRLRDEVTRAIVLAVSTPQG